MPDEDIGGPAEAARAALDQLRQKKDEIEQAIFLGEQFLASIHGLPDEGKPSTHRPWGAGKTNAEVLIELLREAEPEGLLVSELVQILKKHGHKLSRARDPLKATSNELASLRRRGQVHKDNSTGKYRVKQGSR